MYINNNVNECYNVFIEKVDSDISMTSITKTANSKNKCLKEWMTPGLLYSLRNKQKLSSKVLKHPNNHKLHYIIYRNQFSKIIRLAKNKHYINEFKEVSYSPKLTFKLINNVANTNCKIKNDEEIHSILFDNESINTSVNPIKVSNIFNKYFTTIGSNLGGLINKPNFHFDEPNTIESFDTFFNKKSTSTKFY